MTVNCLEYFYTNKFDEKVLLKNKNKTYTVLEIKKLIGKKLDFLNKIKDENIEIETVDSFEFIINFFASAFSGKTIYPVSTEKSNSGMYKLGQETGENIAEFPKINTEDVMVIFSTSGSSGNKKVIKKSLKNLLKEGEDLAEEFGLPQGLEFVSTTTLNHLFGMTFHFMFALNSGGVINTDRINYPENIEGENQILISSPSFLGKMAKYNENCRLNTIITAGARLDDETFDYALQISKNTIEIYGSTETGVIAFRKDYNDNFKVFKNVSVIPEEDCTKVSTPYSFEKENIINDAIEFTSEDKIRLLGRTDRVLKIQEKRISAENIEEELLKNDYIDEAYCLKCGEKLACLAALTSKGMDFALKYGIPKLKEVLKSFLEDKFEIVPQKWKFIDEIPKTISGKTETEKIEEIFNLNLSLPLVLSRKYEPNAATYKLYFYRNCNFFKGHFENYPILPGVVQLLFATLFAKDAFGISCTSGQFRRIKFSNLVTPDNIIDLKLELTERGVDFSYIDKNKIYSSGLLPLKNYWR